MTFVSVKIHKLHLHNTFNNLKFDLKFRFVVMRYRYDDLTIGIFFFP